MENKKRDLIDIKDDLDLSTVYTSTLIKVLNDYEEHFISIKKREYMTPHLFMHEHNVLEETRVNLFNMLFREFGRIEEYTHELQKALENIEES